MFSEQSLKKDNRKRKKSTQAKYIALPASLPSGLSENRELEIVGGLGPLNVIWTGESKVYKKVKFSHRPTRYRALGPELIPVYRQSARR